jgi:anti-sigma28 factor (negative regulator of flagellin synthesis)
MQTEIISRVAEIIRNPVAAKKNHDKAVEQKQDTVELSSAATEWVKKSEGMESDLEKEQSIKVDALKERVEAGAYQLNNEMVDQIAEKIVALF